MLSVTLAGLAGVALASPLSSGTTHNVNRQDAAPELSITQATLTSKWAEDDTSVQIVELVVENNHEQNFLSSKDSLSISIDSASLETKTPGTLARLAPGQSARVQVGVTNKDGTAPGTQCDATAVASYSGGQSSKLDFSGPCGIGTYEANEDSLRSHMSPDWFDEIKFGIFIHWGIYAVPAYGNVPGPNQDYAEWYGFRMTQPDFPSRTYEYHRDTYGEDFNYDDFMANFTGEFFDAQSVMDLVADAGAQYVVPVTKHHDGWSLFDQPESISKRSTIHYGPKRDFIKEILDAAKQDHPEIHRGTYFSMPEWFNPAYVKYGWDQQYKGNYYGRPPTNPYTNESIEFTGYVEVDDYLDDIQNPQIEVLMYNYDTEILWCDIGGPNKSPDVLAKWANWGRDNGKQVLWNNRCGISGDYDTPEYASGSFQERKFESNRGMDPFSFGYNEATKDDQYLTGEEIVKELTDIVSNNGNFLLNIGPKADGSIPDAVTRNLLDAGAWIKSHGEALFGTTYWSKIQHSGSFRYTQKPDAFYILHQGTPGTEVTVGDPVPWLEGDEVTIVGGSKDGETVEASKNGDGQLVIKLSEDQINADKYVWAFKITYATS